MIVHILSRPFSQKEKIISQILPNFQKIKLTQVVDSTITNMDFYSDDLSKDEVFLLPLDEVLWAANDLIIGVENELENLGVETHNIDHNTLDEKLHKAFSYAGVLRKADENDFDEVSVSVRSLKNIFCALIREFVADDYFLIRNSVLSKFKFDHEKLEKPCDTVIIDLKTDDEFQNNIGKSYVLTPIKIENGQVVQAFEQIDTSLYNANNFAHNLTDDVFYTALNEGYLNINDGNIPSIIGTQIPTMLIQDSDGNPTMVNVLFVHINGNVSDISNVIGDEFISTF